jgi:hypothetical protein
LIDQTDVSRETLVNCGIFFSVLLAVLTLQENGKKDKFTAGSVDYLNHWNGFLLLVLSSCDWCQLAAWET